MHITTSFSEFVNYLEKIGAIKNRMTLWKKSNTYFEDMLAKYPWWKDLSNEQIKYYQKRCLPSSFSACQADFIQITYRINHCDSKDIFISPDMKVIYDNDPVWLNIYLQDLAHTFVKNDHNVISNTFCPGGLLSFSHFCGRNLLSISSTKLFPESCAADLFLPFSNQWQKQLVNIYAPKLQLNEYMLASIESSLPFEKYVIHAYDSYIFEELPIWASLYILKTEFTPYRPPIVNPEKIHTTKIYLSRDKYEFKAKKISRIKNNWSLHYMLCENGFKTVFPEEHCLEDIYAIIDSSKVIICSPGSCYMNYILFANRQQNIIQLTPSINLADSLHPLRKFIVQWFIPQFTNFKFFKSKNNMVEIHRASSLANVGNDPEFYDGESLIHLINEI